MVRFIFESKIRDISGLESQGLFTLDVDVPEVEAQLMRGGCAEDHYEHVQLVDAEVVQPNAVVSGGGTPSA